MVTPSGGAQRRSRGAYMPDLRQWTFRMVRCTDGSFYCGITLDAEERVRVHNAGQAAGYTARRRPVMLVYAEPHPTKSAARRRGIQVKSWRVEKKELLVRGFPSTRSDPQGVLRVPRGKLGTNPSTGSGQALPTAYTVSPRRNGGVRGEETGDNGLNSRTDPPALADEPERSPISFHLSKQSVSI